MPSMKQLNLKLSGLTKRVERLETIRQCIAVAPIRAGEPVAYVSYSTENERRLLVAAARGNTFAYGERVAFIRYGGPLGSGRFTCWQGVVIPRPHGCREFGKQHERFVWVLTDSKQIRGCYPWNLVRV